MLAMSIATVALGVLPPQIIKRWMWIVLMVMVSVTLAAVYIFLAVFSTYIVDVTNKPGLYVSVNLSPSDPYNLLTFGFIAMILCVVELFLVVLWVAGLFPPPGTLVTGPRIKAVSETTAGNAPSKRQSRNTNGVETIIPVASDIAEEPPLLPPGNPYATGGNIFV